MRTCRSRGCHIQIDEAHNYAGAHHGKQHIGRWVEWLGEVRHLAVTVEFISQHVMKMAAPVRREVAVKLYLKTTEDDHDPYLGIKIGHWYELLASWTRSYRVVVVEEESRENRGKWEVVDVRAFFRDPFYFELYDSYAAPIKGGVKGRAQKREYEKRGKLGMLLWFYLENAWKLTSRVVLIGLVVWLFGPRRLHGRDAAGQRSAIGADEAGRRDTAEGAAGRGRAPAARDAAGRRVGGPSGPRRVLSAGPPGRSSGSWCPRWPGPWCRAVMLCFWRR